MADCYHFPEMLFFNRRHLDHLLPCSLTNALIHVSATRAAELLQVKAVERLFFLHSLLELCCRCLLPVTVQGFMYKRSVPLHVFRCEDRQQNARTLCKRKNAGFQAACPEHPT